MLGKVLQPQIRWRPHLPKKAKWFSGAVSGEPELFCCAPRNPGAAVGASARGAEVALRKAGTATRPVAANAMAVLDMVGMVETKEVWRRRGTCFDP